MATIFIELSRQLVERAKQIAAAIQRQDAFGTERQIILSVNGSINGNRIVCIGAGRRERIGVWHEGAIHRAQIGRPAAVELRIGHKRWYPIADSISELFRDNRSDLRKLGIIEVSRP